MTSREGGKAFRDNTAKVFDLGGQKLSQFAWRHLWTLPYNGRHHQHPQEIEIKKLESQKEIAMINNEAKLMLQNQDAKVEGLFKGMDLATKQQEMLAQQPPMPPPPPPNPGAPPAPPMPPQQPPM